MQPIRAIPVSLCRSLEVLLTDLDDTLTEGGMLPPSSYAALWELYRAGIQVAPVTGRPAGWCDHLARMWPVAGVVGENGAFVYVYHREEKLMERRYLLCEAERLEGARRLEVVKRRVLAEVPACGISADQGFRAADLAIDIREDVAPLAREQVERILEIARQEGATCKLSSIHVNIWYGSFDKVAGIREFLRLSGKGELEDFQERILFIGDSPNDEPLFQALKSSVGVANIAPFLDRLHHPPAYLTERPAAAGFCEAVSTILSRR